MEDNPSVRQHTEQEQIDMKQQLPASLYCRLMQWLLVRFTILRTQLSCTKHDKRVRFSLRYFQPRGYCTGYCTGYKHLKEFIYVEDSDFGEQQWRSDDKSEELSPQITLYETYINFPLRSLQINLGNSSQFIRQMWHISLVHFHVAYSTICAWSSRLQIFL